MDILLGVDSGLVTKIFTDHKDNVMSTEIITTNNNIFNKVNIDLNAMVQDIYSFLPTEMSLALDQMNSNVF